MDAGRRHAGGVVDLRGRPGDHVGLCVRCRPGRLLRWRRCVSRSRGCGRRTLGCGRWWRARTRSWRLGTRRWRCCGAVMRGWCCGWRSWSGGWGWTAPIRVRRARGSRSGRGSGGRRRGGSGRATGIGILPRGSGRRSGVGVGRSGMSGRGCGVIRTRAGWWEWSRRRSVRRAVMIWRGPMRLGIIGRRRGMWRSCGARWSTGCRGGGAGAAGRSLLRCRRAGRPGRCPTGRT